MVQWLVLTAMAESRAGSLQKLSSSPGDAQPFWHSDVLLAHFQHFGAFAEVAHCIDRRCRLSQVNQVRTATERCSAHTANFMAASI